MITFLIILVLLHISYQDFKSRSVLLLSFGLLIIAGVAINVTYVELHSALLSICLNFAGLTLVVLVLYLYVRYKMNLSFLDAIGIGDVLLWVVMAIMFSVRAFVWIFCFSMIFSLVVSLIFFKKQKNEVPLAGLQCIFIMGVLLYWSCFRNIEELYN